MKQCSKCKKLLTLDLFSKDKATKDWLYPSCIVCIKAKNSKFYLNNREKVKQRNLKWRAENREIDNKLAREWRKKNPESYKAVYDKSNAKTMGYNVEWNRQARLANPVKYRVRSTERYAQKLKRMPSYANKDVIEVFYWVSRQMWVTMGIQYHVDHIIPLRGKIVSWLHHEWNLQVMRWWDNCKKSNTFY